MYQVIRVPRVPHVPRVQKYNNVSCATVSDMYQMYHKINTKDQWCQLKGVSALTPFFIVSTALQLFGSRTLNIFMEGL